MTAVAPTDAVAPPRRTAHVIAAVRERHLLSAAIATVVLVAVAVALTRDFRPVGDWALPELFVRQIPHELPLVGPYSLGRGFSHPSPLFFYGAAVPYLLSGGRSSALLAASLFVNGAALVAAVWIGERRSGPGLGIALVLGVALTGWGHDSSFLVMPWNPYVAAIPFITLIVATWSLWAGASRWTIPWIVAIGAWCVGAHMGFGAPVLGVGLIATGGAIAAVRTGRWLGRDLWAPVGVALGVAVLMWLPTLFDLIRNGTGGNTGDIWRFVTDPPVGRVPLNEALNVLGSELSLHPYWAGGMRPETALGFPGHASFPWMLPFVGVAFGLAWRRHATKEVAGIAVALGSLLAAFAGAALTHSAELLSWYIVPADMAGIALAAFTVWSLGSAIGHRLGGSTDRRRVVRGVIIALGVVAVAAGTVRLVTVDDIGLDRSIGRATSALAPALVRAYGTERPLVVANTLVTREQQVGVVLGLARAGVAVHVPSLDEERFGAWWSRPAPADAVHLVLTAGSHPPEVPGRRLVAVSPASPFMLGGGDRVAVWEVPHDAATTTTAGGTNQ